MGNRRMISKTVTQTHRFLRLPLEAQALYFHLIQNCDDDGVVEAFPILRMIGANEDNLGLLVIKQFVKPLNDEMVYFVVDFHEQNTVRKDRYVPSIYKELLEENTDGITGKPLVNQTTTTGCPNISKDNESKYNLSKFNSREDETSENSQMSSSAAADSQSDFNIFEYYQERIGPIDGYQMEKLKGYIDFDKLEIMLVKRAIDRAADNSKRGFGYINSILRAWAQNGIHTVFQQDEEQRKFDSRKSFDDDRPVKFGPACSKY
ncbi:DnaD domain-containing protein [Streptococcus salivarius]|uniref:DnaD domain-containing protein n=1 Tax=Streptococcus salivarius TaxID=1304 RepID=UPI0020014CA1|nr:DnaD domain protein [Streptococcus salivarius]